ncbi:MAG: phenylalanine--tRNA ligase subunit beta [Holosporaceae bacterium]|jgi:phenylalanyl-tRNA synthetase beta chain|nr:phenylalanine--tRNA ligase subunit beta [Holosporaceae bacterium]
MRFTFGWLKRHLSTDWSAKKIAERLTPIGLEVESFLDPDVVFKNFKLVRLERVERHPNADRLKVCIVSDCNGKKAQIVCGAKNVLEGLVGVLALPGAIIPNSGAQLSKSKIRGVESNGMLCSYEELSLPMEGDGIIDLGHDIDLSTSVGDALGFQGGVFDVAVTPNRGDCFSVKGIARDLAAAGAGTFLAPEEKCHKSSFAFPLQINYNNSNACCKYAPVIAFRIIRNLENGPSPESLQSLFRSVGTNSISSVVDLSNFLMMDSGRPIHIYDLDKIDGQITISFAKNKEKFIDIKGKEHVLQQDMLVAADKKDVLCLLGIMGGAKAACSENTKNILIESALLDPIFISRTGSFLNINSDSRTRFERGIDHDSCVPGLEAITSLIVNTCGGTASDICVVGTHPKVKRTIELTQKKLHSISGCDVNWATAKKILKKLGLKEVATSEESARFLMPSWRADLNVEEDLVEEILRINGYDNICGEEFCVSVNAEDRLLERENTIIAIKRLLCSVGLSEVISYSFIKSEYADAFRENRKAVQLLNPISDDMSVLRLSLLPSLILAATRSLNYGQSHVEICESGNIFFDACLQEMHVAGLRAGDYSDRSWAKKNRKADVFDVKGDLMTALSYFGIAERDVITKPEAPSYYHPSRSGSICVCKKNVGYFGELHPRINKLFSLSEPLLCFELMVDKIPAMPSKNNSNSDKVFPKIIRDFSFVFDQSLPVGSVLSAIYALDNKIVKADIFDLFDIDDKKKAVGITITIEATDRTLTEQEAQTISNKIIKLVEETGGKLRER